MVKVAFKADKGNITLTMTGHAGQAEEGHDLVCSACSILAYTLGTIVNTEHSEGAFLLTPLVHLAKGNAAISCEPRPEKYNEILHAFYVAEVGYTLLAHNYPQYVELTVFGEPIKA